MRRNEDGLTLVEVLAGIALLSLILLLASSVHLFAQKQSNAQKEDNRIHANERLAFNRITKEIRKADPTDVDVEDPNILKIRDKELGDEIDEYKLVGTTLILKDGEEIPDISQFTVNKVGNKINLKIGSRPEVTIFLR